MKKLLPFLIIVSLFCFQTTKVLALFGVGDIVFDPAAFGEFVANNAMQGMQFAKEVITSNSAMSLQVKEYALDPAAKIMADLVLNSEKTLALNWINSGFKGNPTFISNTDVYFKNMATGVVRTNIADISKSNSPFANSVAGSLVAKTRNDQSPLSQQLAPTLGTSIQNDVCTDAKLTEMAKNYANAGVSVGNNSLDSIKTELRKELCTSDATNKAQQTKLNDCFATDFNCGGWGAWLQLTGNPNNTLTGQIIAANTATAQKQAENVENKKNEGKTLSITNCVDAPTLEVVQNDFYNSPTASINNPNKVPCQNEEVSTPASAVENTAKMALDSGWTSLANAHELGDVLTGVLSGSLSGLMGKGLSSMGNSGKRVTLDTLSGAGPVDVTPTNTTISSSTQEEMTPEKRKSLLTTINNQLNSHLSAVNNLKGIDSSYLSTENSYVEQLNSLSACYDQAVAIYSYYANADSRLINGRSFVAGKMQIYNAKIQELNNELALVNTTISGITDTKNKLSSAVEASKIIDIYTDYQTKNSSGYYVGDQEYATRYVESLSNKQIVEADTTALNGYFGINGTGFGNFGTFGTATGCYKLKIDAQTASSTLQNNYNG